MTKNLKPLTKEYITSPFMIGTMRLGKWGYNMTSSEIEKFVEGCIENRLVDFDHADIYGSYTTESDFGSVLKIKPDLRNQIRITTKCGIKIVSENRPEQKIKSYDLTKKHIKKSVENSLIALQTEYIDTLLLHRPDFLFDPYDIADAFNHNKVYKFDMPGEAQKTHCQEPYGEYLGDVLKYITEWKKLYVQQSDS